MTDAKPERCEGSNATQSSEEWATAETITCLRCGHVVKYRVRASDMPPWGRVMPHRVDGSPSR